jgi:hypothetical protein
MILMINIVKKWLGAVTGFCSLTFISIAFAQTPTLVNPLGDNSTFQTVLANISSFLLVIAAPICGIMVVWGGFQMITARGNPEKFSEGKKTLLYAAVGFVIVIFASSVAPLIQSIFGGS